MISRRLLHYHPPQVPRSIEYPPTVSNIHDIFDPCVSWPPYQRPKQLKEVEEESPEPKEVTSKEKNAYTEELTIAKKEGCAPIKRALTVLLDSLQKRSGMSTSLSSLNVSLFNFHSTKFAERLLQRNIGSLALVESSFSNAKVVKDFATQQRKHFKSVSGVHADISSLLGIGMKKVIKLPVILMPPNVVDKPLTLEASQDVNDESGRNFDNSPILICCLPTTSQQTAVIQALKANLLMHHSGEDPDTIYRYGAVDLMTFLDIRIFAPLMSSVDPRLVFYSHSHRRNSALLNKLFDIQLLREESFDYSSFYPAIPKSPKADFPHKKKLEELKFRKNQMLAVSIRPSTNITIGDTCLERVDAEGRSVSKSVLLPFSFWQHKIGQCSNTTTVSDALKVICPESFSSVDQMIDMKQRVGDVPNTHLETIFMRVHPEISSSRDFHKYVSSFKTKRIL